MLNNSELLKFLNHLLIHIIHYLFHLNFSLIKFLNKLHLPSKDNLNYSHLLDIKLLFHLLISLIHLSYMHILLKLIHILPKDRLLQHQNQKKPKLFLVNTLLKWVILIFQIHKYIHYCLEKLLFKYLYPKEH